MKDTDRAVSRRQFLRLGLYNTAGVSVGSLLLIGAAERKTAPEDLSDLEQEDQALLVLNRRPRLDGREQLLELVLCELYESAI